MDDDDRLKHNGPWRAPVSVACIRDADVSLGARVLYADICGYANAEGVAWPSITRLAEDIGVERRSAIRYLKELEKAGYITVERRQDPDTKEFKNNIYTINAIAQNRVENGDVTTRSSDSGVTTPSDKAVTTCSDTGDTRGSDQGVTQRIPSEPTQERDPDNEIQDYAALPRAAPADRRNGRQSDDVPEPEPERKPRARSPAQQAQDAMCAAIADVCFAVKDSAHFELLPTEEKTNTRRAARALRTAEYTPDDVYEFWDWWRRTDWRGQKKQRPTVRQLKSEWPKFWDEGSGRNFEKYISGEFADYIEH